MATAAAMEPPQGNATVLYFASVADFAARESEDLPAPLPLGKLFDVLEERHPGMRDLLGSCLVTVNLEYVDLAAGDGVIEVGDEVAVIPPVSSG